MFFFIGYSIGNEAKIHNNDFLSKKNNETSINDLSDMKKNEKNLSVFEENLKNELDSMDLEIQSDPLINPEEIHSPPKDKSISEKKNNHDETKQMQSKKTIENNAKSSQKMYSLQIGAFVHEKDAKILQKKLSKKSISTRIDRGIRFWFVRAMKVPHQKELKDLENKLTKMNFQPIIVSY